MAVHDVYVVILIILFHTNERCFCSFTVHKKHCKIWIRKKLFLRPTRNYFWLIWQLIYFSELPSSAKLYNFKLIRQYNNPKQFRMAGSCEIITYSGNQTRYVWERSANATSVLSRPPHVWGDICSIQVRVKNYDWLKLDKFSETLSSVAL